MKPAAARATTTSKPLNNKASVEEYAWERTYERTWESVQEDESGLLLTDASAGRRRRRRPGGGAGAGGGGVFFNTDGGEEEDEDEVNGGAFSTRVQRGMLRNLFIILDLSQAMLVNDLKPNRATVVSKVLTDFIHEYFDQNPISQLGLIVTRGGIAEKITDLSGNPRKHMSVLADTLKKPDAIYGEMTLQTSLDIACRTLALQPAFGTREVLLVHGAHSSRDPGAINETISLLLKHRVRVSVISLPGEVYLPSRIANETHGTYSVPEDFDALRSQVMDQCRPSPRRLEDTSSSSGAAAAAASAQMVKVGFPELVQETEGICTCHKTLHAKAYVCPQCFARCCEIPTECAVCRLQLVSAPGLARSYHHLFPVAVFVEVPSMYDPGVLRMRKEVGGDEGEVSGDGGKVEGTESDGITTTTSTSTTAPGAFTKVMVHDASTHCTGCLSVLHPSMLRYVCPECKLAFCVDCDQVIHETIHNCPGCVGM